MAEKQAPITAVYHEDYLLHTYNGHPECKERLEYIVAALEREAPRGGLKMIEPAPAVEEDLALVHDRDYIASIEAACRKGRPFLDPDTYIVPESYRVALLSAGGALAGLRETQEGSGKVFVLNRPPGHHAERARAMGFCLFNNIAVAAAVARRDHGLERVAIVDWDVHHGNGTQHTFEGSREVLFISTHQSPAYPGSGGVNETGHGEGAGFTVNIPLPPGCGDAEYMHCFEQVILPVLDQYRPELLLVSAGQDAYQHDPLAGMGLTRGGYYRMAAALRGVAERHCGGRMLLCLEGGYDLEGQAGAVLQVFNALGDWGLPVDQAPGETGNPGRIGRRMEEVLAAQRKFWDL